MVNRQCFHVFSAFCCGALAGVMLTTPANSFLRLRLSIGEHCSPNVEDISYWLQQSGSDKFHTHHYERYYKSWLGDMRCKHDLKIVEIGAQKGQSLNAWERIFPNSEVILGVAYGPGTTRLEDHVSKRISLLWGDQSKKETMDAVVERGPWDIIIDDGSHLPQHMMYSFFSLWQKALKPGGIYVIEDLETNYWRDGDGLYGYIFSSVGIATTANYSAVKKIDQIREVLMRFQIGARNLTVAPGDGELCAIEWGMNIVRLRKCTEAEVKSNPPWAPIHYDEHMMDGWLREAHSTNPAL